MCIFASEIKFIATAFLQIIGFCPQKMAKKRNYRTLNMYHLGL